MSDGAHAGPCGWSLSDSAMFYYRFQVMHFLYQKGQHLEPFIQSFFNSCESPKPKPSRPELTILSPTSENDKKVRGSFSWSSRSPGHVLRYLASHQKLKI